MSKLLAIVGPTASGKTEVSLEVARKLKLREVNAEIINADSMQLYKGMDIATAKLTPQQRADVPHHLFDVYEPEQEVSVVGYQAIAREVITEVLHRGNQPILVGGSMLYLASVMDILDFAPTDPAVRSKLEQELSTVGSTVLWQRLADLDARTAANINPENNRRIVRALEIIALQGLNYGAQLSKQRQPWMPLQIFGIHRERDQLKHRIEQRTTEMWRSGLLEEAARLRGRLGVTAKVAIGYQQAFDYLDGLIDQQQAEAEIVRLSNRYVKKQMTWFRADTRIQWLSGENIAEQIVESL